MTTHLPPDMGVPQPPPMPFQSFDVESLVTEDDTPVESFYVDMLAELLKVILKKSWTPPDGGRFLVAADVGLWTSPHLPAIVPDVMVSLGVTVNEDVKKKKNRSYFVWEFGKPPELVIEIVSNDEGQELGFKVVRYAEIGVKYYVVWDPLRILSDEDLTCFVLQEGKYEKSEPWFPLLQLGLRPWQGEIDKVSGDWLRWTYKDGSLVPLVEDSLAQERELKEHEREQKEHERKLKEIYAEKLRSLGIDPDQLS